MKELIDLIKRSDKIIYKYAKDKRDGGDGTKKDRDTEKEIPKSTTG